MPNNTNPLKVILGPDTRWSYVNAWEPKAMNGQAPKYSVSFIIKKDSEDVEKVKEAIQKAYEEGIAKLKGNSKVAPKLDEIKNPLRDGDVDRPSDPAYAGCYFINAKSDDAPGIVDANRQDILDRSEIYSGVYGRASVSFYAYNSNGNKGIACSLNHLQKFRDGEHLGGKASAYSDFADDDCFLD